MIVGLGTDLVRISRIEKIYHKYRVRFLEKILTREEQERFQNIQELHGIRYLAKRFAAKEALVKSLGTGFSVDVQIKDISIKNDSLGKPYYELSKKLHKYISGIFNTNNYSINLSITDDKEYANAVAIIEKLT